MNEKIKPRSPGGFKDYLPENMIAKQNIISKIKRTYELFGFVPLETHCVEFREILDGNNPDFGMEIFKFKGEINGSPNELAMRFDLTVPLARIITAYPDLPKPFKRYQMGLVWRGEKPQAGRFHEFMQFDVDIIGSNSTYADSEIIAVMYNAFKNIGINDFVIKINNRKVLNALSYFAGYDQEISKKIFRIIDKCDKIGFDGIQKEMQEIVDQDTINKILKFINIHGSNEKILDQALSIIGKNQEGLDGINELATIIESTQYMDVPNNHLKIDLSIARGLEYYTGPVFETYLNDYPQIGSVCSGGRYDNLVTRFKNVSLPATGASIGIDRLLTALDTLGKIKKRKSLTNVFIVRLDPNLDSEYLKISSLLRNEGISTEFYLGSEKTIKGQLNYAIKQEIPITLLMGSNEWTTKTVAIKDMIARQQQSVKIDHIVKKIKQILQKQGSVA